MGLRFLSNFLDSGPSFEELVMPHMSQLHRLAYHYTGQQSDAEDLVQDLLLKLYPQHKEMRAVETLRPWLTKVLYRLYIDRWRQQQRRATETADHGTLEQYQPIDTYTSAERLVLIRDLQWALSQLSDEQRILITMHDVESYTLAELEQILETPLGTLKSRLHRSRAKLRQLLAGEGTVSKQAACL